MRRPARPRSAASIAAAAPGKSAGTRASLLAAAALVASGAAALALAGCQDILNALLDSAAPVGVSASDGEYANTIRVDWGEPNLSSDKWKDYRVDRYEVSWTGPDSDSGSTTGTSYAIQVSDSNRARLYTVTVEAKLRKGASVETGGSASDDGFALDAVPLSWIDGGEDFGVPAGAERWYVTMLQRGFTYSFDFGSGTGKVEYYRHRTLDLASPAGSVDRIQSWKCDDDGTRHKFFVRVEPSPGVSSFRASYGF